MGQSGTSLAVQLEEHEEDVTTDDSDTSAVCGATVLDYTQHLISQEDLVRILIQPWYSHNQKQ